MGKINRGILGGFSGKVANVVGGSWKGIPYMRAMPLSVSQPNTAKQINQRTAMADIVTCAQSFLGAFIKPLMDRSAIGMSGYNLFVQKNIPIFTATDPAFMQYQQLIMSDGKMDSTPISLLTITPQTNTFKVDWINDSNAGFKLDTDKAYIAICDEFGSVIVNWTGTTERSTGTASFAGQAGTALLATHVYLAFKRADGLVIGKTSYYRVQ